jgi:rRNA maturation RNase YbeY
MIDIRNTTKGTLRVPFARIADHILGSSYQLSLVICGDTLARSMNARYRQKTYKPNVLSFPLSKTEGEIFLNIAKATREARSKGVSLNERVTYLFIHACLHLKGLPHGSRMDALEVAFMRRSGYPSFTLND